jgi:acyl-coenzyme A thioesterase PaaI-like protein
VPNPTPTSAGRSPVDANNSDLTAEEGSEGADGADGATTSRLRLGAAIRRLSHATVGHEIDAASMDRIADEMDRIAAQWEQGDARSRPHTSFDYDIAELPAIGGRMHSHSDRPFSGRTSPLGIDVEVLRQVDGVEAHLTLGSAHEGAPGRAHGGIISGLLDDLLGFLLPLERTMAFTGELTIRYEIGVPLHVPLVCRLRKKGREGRKLYLAGELMHGEQVLTRATGTFIVVDPASFPHRR